MNRYAGVDVCTVAQALASGGRNRRLWKQRYLDAVNVYLLLMHQAEFDTSYYLLSTRGNKTPMFPPSWLARKLTGMEGRDFVAGCIDYWTYGIGWAEEETYHRVVRHTISDYLNAPGGGTRARDEPSDQLSGTLAAALPECSQVLLSLDRTILSRVPECPGWVLDAIGL